MKAEISALQALAANRKFGQRDPQRKSRSTVWSPRRQQEWVSAGDRRGAGSCTAGKVLGIAPQEAMLSGSAQRIATGEYSRQAEHGFLKLQRGPQKSLIVIFIDASAPGSTRFPALHTSSQSNLDALLD